MGKSHIGLVHSQQINDILDKLANLVGNTVMSDVSVGVAAEGKKDTSKFFYKCSAILR